MKFDFTDKYILLLCEGKAEKSILEILLNNEMLIFDRKQLIMDKVHLIRSPRDVEQDFLHLSYEKELIIIRICDSKKENFRLHKAYDQRVFSFYTRPEIEILPIIKEGHYQKYKNRQNIKPSTYCKQILKMKNVKNSEFIFEYFKNPLELREILKQYHTYLQGKENCIYDLLKQ